MSLHNTWRVRRKMRRERSCPHSLVNARGRCQMCGQRGIDRTQHAAHIDGSGGAL